MRVELYINEVLANVNPIWNDSTSIKIERAEGEMYRKRTFSPSVKFVREGYDAIYSSGLDADFKVKFYEGNVLLCEGTFEKTDCNFDTDNKTCSVNVSSIDAYDKILAKKGDEYDIVKLAPARETITLYKRPILQIYAFHDTKVTNIVGGNYYEVDVNSSIDIDGMEESNLPEYGFAKVGAGGVSVVVSETPSGYDYLEGTYTGEWNGKDTILSQSGGVYKIKMLRLQDPGAFTKDSYCWAFFDLNGDAITYTYHGFPFILSTKQRYDKYADIRDANKWGINQGRDEDYESRFIEVEGFDVSAEDTTIFARIIVDDPSISGLGDISAEDLCATNLNYRYYLEDYTEGIGGQVSIHRSSSVRDEPTEWGVNGKGKYFVKPTYSPSSSSVIPVGWNRWIPRSIWVVLSVNESQSLDEYSDIWELNDAYPLWSVLQVLLKEIDPSVTFEGTSEYSQFLYGTYLEIPEYVNQLLYITPITNVKKTYYSEAARSGKLSLENIFNMLKAMQCYWFIDDQKRLRIEHINWFKSGGSSGQPVADTTTIKSPMSFREWSFGTNTITFRKGDLYNRYEFAWAEGSDLFNGYPINIENRYAKAGKTLKTDIPKFVTDIDLIISAPDLTSDDNFALIGVNSNKRCPIAWVDNMGMDFTSHRYFLQNGYLSFYFLELVYWRYNLGGYYANMEISGGKVPYDVRGTQKVKTQKVKFPLSASKFGQEGLVKTGIGSGEWVSCNYTTEDGMAEMELIFDNYDESIVSFDIADIVKTDNMQLVGYTSSFELACNDASLSGDISIRVRANRNINVKITASCRNFDYGYESDKRESASTIAQLPAAQKCTYQEEKTVSLTAGDIFYLGFIKQGTASANENKIIFTFSAR